MNKTFSHLSFTALFFFLLPSLQASKSIVVYTDDAPHLLPFIEQALISLKDRNGNNIFQNVINLTRVIENELDEQITIESRGLLAKESLLAKEIPLEERTALAKTLYKYDYFLKINTIVVADVIEFQFFLYDILKLDYKNEEYLNRLVNDIQNPNKMLAFFINPKSENYEKVLTKNLTKLFPFTNHLPIAKLIANKRVNSEYIYLALSDTLVLDASFSSDIDNEKEDLTYFWNQVSSAKDFQISDTMRIPIKKETIAQEITFKEIGTYYIALTVFDGIDYSDTIYLTVYVIFKPVLLLRQKDQYFVSTRRKKESQDTFVFNLPIDYYLYYDLNNTTFDIERKTMRALYGNDLPAKDKFPDKIVNSLYKDFYFPDVLDISIKQNGKTKSLTVKFSPEDAELGINKYKFEVISDYNGVISNVGKFNIDYFRYGKNNFRIFYGLSGVQKETDFDAEVITIKWPDSLKANVPTTDVFSRNPIHFQYIHSLYPNLDLEVGFVFRSLLGVRRYTAISDAPTSNGYVLFYQDIGWNSFFIPQIGFGVKSSNMFENDRFLFRIYASIRYMLQSRNLFPKSIPVADDFTQEIKDFISIKSKSIEVKGNLFYPSFGSEINYILFPNERISIFAGWIGGIISKKILKGENFTFYLTTGLSYNFY